MNPDRLAELEEERRFLLASIRDLDRERVAGDVDDADFHTLRDGYVARAAAVMREIDDGRSSLPPRPHRPWWRRLAVPVATLALATVLGIAVAQFAGQRLPGQGITGGLANDDVASLLASARQSMMSDPTAALAAYDKVLGLEPGNAEAVTYRAWLQVIQSMQQGDQAGITAQIPELRRAITLDPEYADPYCLLAVATGRFQQPPDTATSKSAAQECLARNPPSELASSIQALATG